jgi:hypothetical protein
MENKNSSSHSLGSDSPLKGRVPLFMLPSIDFAQRRFITALCTQRRLHYEALHPLINWSKYQLNLEDVPLYSPSTKWQFPCRFKDEERNKFLDEYYFSKMLFQFLMSEAGFRGVGDVANFDTFVLNTFAS